MTKVQLEAITPNDYKYIKLRTRPVLPLENPLYVAEVVYEDGFGMTQILKRSVSSVPEEAVDDVITTTGMFFLREI